MNHEQVAAVFQRNMTALVADAAKRRRAKVLDAANSRPSLPYPNAAA